MISVLGWRLWQLTRQLWFRASLISLLAVGAALLSLIVSPYLPSDLSAKIGADAVDRILEIIASSMLAVTTFSLSTMVAAYSAATTNVTPRATKLLIQDTTTQNMLATFIGSFLYSLVAIITLAMGAYGERGRVVLFAVTLCVILLIVVTLLRWIDYVIRLGRVGQTTEAVEAATASAIRARIDNPYLGGVPMLDGGSRVEDAVSIHPARAGYVQHVDVQALQRCAKEQDVTIYLDALPGTFVDPSRALVRVEGDASENVEKTVRDAFSIGAERSYEQDPRFGLIVLAEIASRALSPSTNDPGTAIDVIGRSVRLLSQWAEPSTVEDPVCDRVYVPAIAVEDMFDDIYMPIARDGAGFVEVQIRLQKALGALAKAGDGRLAPHAASHAASALARAGQAMNFDADRERVRSAAILV